MYNEYANIISRMEKEIDMYEQRKTISVKLELLSEKEEHVHLIDIFTKRFSQSIKIYR